MVCCVGLRDCELTVQYPLCISLMETGRVDVKPLITNRFSFGESQVNAGFDTAARSEELGAIKVMFNLDQTHAP
jgi:L-iditol 2-dehydrogenase